MLKLRRSKEATVEAKPPSPTPTLKLRCSKKASEVNAGCGAVGSASGLGPEGRQFESGHPDIKKSESVSEHFHSFFSKLALILTLSIDLSEANAGLYYLG